jgi:hypothetical protein
MKEQQANPAITFTNVVKEFSNYLFRSKKDELVIAQNAITISKNCNFDRNFAKSAGNARIIVQSITPFKSLYNLDMQSLCTLINYVENNIVREVNRNLLPNNPIKIHLLKRQLIKTYE